MESGNTDWGKSVAAVVLRDSKVLLGRHTYGDGKGCLILPGGYINIGEAVEEAVVRETQEETGVLVRPTGLVGVRTNAKDWYLIFRTEYVSGEARPCDKENSEILWMDIAEALAHDDVPELTKWAIRSAEEKVLQKRPYMCEREHEPYAYYG